MKKLLTALLGLVLFFGMSVAVLADEETPEHTIPVTEKPVYITVKDDLGAPLSGASVQILDSDGNVIKTFEEADETISVFLPEGTYTMKVTQAPSGYMPADAVEFTVRLTEAEERVDIRGDTVLPEAGDSLCSPFCSGHGNPPSYANRIESYVIYDEDKTIRAFCFNHMYDPPTPDDPDAAYKRLVGSPELLYELAQTKLPGITAQELYDHVVSIIYHRDYILEKYGLGEVMTDQVVGMAIKNFTDGDLDDLKTNDRDGNNMVLRRNNDGTTGPIVYDENGNYQFRPGGCYLGSAVAHANGDHSGDSDYVFPQAYKDAWDELVEMTDHPEDYYLYIYYPKTFHDREYWRAWTEENYPNLIAHYANKFYANDPQCMLSTFVVEPLRTSLTVRQTTEIEIRKIWDDADDQDGKRPESIKVNLLADGEQIRTAEVRPDEKGDWSYTFSDLPKYGEDGEEIVYTITEDEVPGYDTDIEGFEVTNTLIETPPPPTGYTGRTTMLWFAAMAVALMTAAGLLLFRRKED